MAQETLNRIKEAELEAKQLVKDAQTSGTEIIAAAKEEVLSYKEELISKARKEAKAQLEKAESGMQQALDAAQKRAETVIGQFSADLDKKKDQAVKKVIDYII